MYEQLMHHKRQAYIGAMQSPTTQDGQYQYSLAILLEVLHVHISCSKSSQVAGPIHTVK